MVLIPVVVVSVEAITAHLRDFMENLRRRHYPRVHILQGYLLVLVQVVVVSIVADFLVQVIQVPATLGRRHTGLLGHIPVLPIRTLPIQDRTWGHRR